MIERKNIFDVIKDSDSNEQYLFYEGFFLDKDRLKGKFISDSVYTTPYLQPIVVPGYHISDFDITDENYLANYYENPLFEIYKAEDPSFNDNNMTHQRAMVYYAKLKEKGYSTGYFKVFERSDQVLSSVGTPNKGNIDVSKFKPKGKQSTFQQMFSGRVGSLITLEMNCLSFNLYGIAGRESILIKNNKYINNKEISLGWFQVNLKSNPPDSITKYMKDAAKFINTNYATKIKMSENLFYNWWEVSTYTADHINADAQLIAYVGYLLNNNVLKTLIQEKITNPEIFSLYAKAQRFYGYDNKNSNDYKRYYKDVNFYATIGEKEKIEYVNLLTEKYNKINLSSKKPEEHDRFVFQNKLNPALLV